MKTIKHILPRLFSLALVMILTLALAVPSMAASDGLTITIKNNEGLPSMSDNQFTAYQLFKGTPNKETDPNNSNVTKNDWGASNWNNYTLADIEWGDGVKGSQLLTALKALTNENGAWAFAEEKNVFATCITAEDVAKVLVGKNNAFLQAFSKFVVSGNDTGYLTSTGTNSTATQGSTDAEDTSTITVTDPGYYLIVENGDHAGKADAVSEYILAVLGDQTLNIKADLPEVDKDIVTGEDTTAKGDTAGIGDVVTFKLTGTLPKNYADFTEYYYVFHDTLSAGLTFTSGSVKVTVDEKTVNTDSYKVESGADGKLTITFDDLKTIKDTEGNAITLTADSEIIVTYTTKVNENAVIGSTGNPNEVYLEYSNDPNSDSKGKTTEKKVYVYSFGLDLKKVGSDSEHASGLVGAEFTLSKVVIENGVSKTYYATFEDGTDANGKTGHKVLTGWTDKEAEAGKLTSGENGKIPQVDGLDAGDYVLTETKTPNGYNTMDPIHFTIKATITEKSEPSMLTELSATLTKNGEEARTDVDFQDGNVGTGVIQGTLTNQKAPFLPFTGGIGTMIFYIAGGLLIVGALTYFIVSAHKRGKENMQ